MKVKRFLSVCLIVIALSAFMVPTALALSDSPPSTVLDVILSVFVQFAQLAGIGAAIAAVVNVLKAFKVVSDGTAGKWFAGLNLLAIGGLVYLKIFQPQIAIEFIDAQAAVLRRSCFWSSAM